MLYRPHSFRKSAIALTTGAAMAAIAAFPAAAQQASHTNFGKPDCASAADPALRAICESFKRTEDAKKRGAAADARGAAADARGAAAAQVITCMQDLMKFKARSPEEFAKLGPITKETACIASAKIPRPTASLN